MELGTNCPTTEQLVSRLEELAGAFEEYDDYLDRAAAAILINRLEELVNTAGEAQESDHEDDETTEDEDEDTDSE